MKKYDAVIAGYLCVDMFPEFRKTGKDITAGELFRPGKLIETEGLKISLGGVVANTGLAMKKFGRKVFLNGLTGNDQIGQVGLKILEQYGCHEGIQSTDEATTAYSIVLAPRGIDRIFLESPGCSNLFNLDHINLDSIKESRLFHFGYPPLLEQFYRDNGSMLVKMFSTIKSMDVITSLDMSLMDPSSKSFGADWTGILKGVLPNTDIFVPSAEEIFQMLRPEEYVSLQSSERDMAELISPEMIRDIGKQLIGMGAKICLIKAGELGAYLVCGEKFSESWSHCELWCDVFPADPSRIVNSCGSGDIAVAAFLSALLEGVAPDRAIMYAGIAGRNNLFCNDLYEDLPGWDEMTDEIESIPGQIKYLN